MMDKEAVIQMQEGATIDQAVVAVKTALDCAKPGAVPVVALPDRYTLHDIEKFMPLRARFRGGLTTNSIDEFCRYCKDNAQEGATYFISPTKMRARAVLDLGLITAPGHGQHTATVALERTAEYASLLEVNASALTQEQLGDWLEDWADNIVVYDVGGAIIPVSKAVSAVRVVTIESVKRTTTEQQPFRSERSDLEKIAAKTEDGLPSFVDFICTPYHHLDERRFNVRISIKTGGREPAFIVKVRQLDVHEFEMREDFKVKVNAVMDNSITGVIGDFDY